jgi:glycerol-3-phosphate acyltransferase PlsY
MATDDMLRALLALVIGLLLGSVLPADFFAHRRGVDIRSNGDGNPGTVNAVRVLGWAPGLITAAYDLSVGVLAVRIAVLLGVAGGPAYLAGVMSIVGHRFPVFRGFRGGGQGMAASAGLLVYGIAIAVARGRLSGWDVGALVAVVLVTFALTRSDVAAALVMLPVLVVRVILARTDWQFLAFMSVMAGHIWIVQAGVARQRFRLRPASPVRGQTRD